MTDKTRWLGLGPGIGQRERADRLTAQPQYKGLVKGDYYRRLRYSGRWATPATRASWTWCLTTTARSPSPSSTRLPWQLLCPPLPECQQAPHGVPVLPGLP
ncbi:MAG: hypothetical protein ACLTYN_05285 [Dysosmobacter welbionis]